MEKKITDKQRLDFVDKNNIEVGLDHMGYGDYREYANGPFPKIRDVIDKMMRNRGAA